jgi:uncharacterized protein (DUF2147 family)
MRRYFLVFLFFLFGVTKAFAADMSSPIGDWKIQDDVTGRVEAIIQIKEEGNSLSGTLIKTYPLPNEKPGAVCAKCDKSDPRYNKPILGMTILSGFEDHKGDLWSNGKILDPQRGSVYNCQMRLVDNGKKLSVRGFVGIPLFGRTQTWVRVLD